MVVTNVAHFFTLAYALIVANGGVLSPTSFTSVFTTSITITGLLFTSA